jgi:hypothetical protein
VGDPLELAGDLTDPEHRLPGEEESEGSPLLEDAQHWLQVYAELLRFKRTLIRTTEIHKERAPQEVVEEVSNDQVILRSELDRLVRRHRFWEERVQRLQAGRG